jgi:uncharacterized protein
VPVTSAVMPRPLAAVLLGLAAGFFSGMFGIGGGLVMVPALVVFMSLPQHRAHATSMAAIVLVAAAAAVPFAASGEVAWRYTVWLLAGSLVGAVVGARAISRISATWLARGFVVLALAAAARLGFGS